MTEGRDTHYQPWVQGAGAPDDERRVEKPAPIEPDFGAPYIRPLPTDAGDESWGALAAKSSRKAGRSLQKGWNAFADWTIRIGDKADVPSKVAAMRLDEKAKSAASAVGEASRIAASKTAEASKIAAAKTAEGAKVAADKTAQGARQLSRKTAASVAKLEIGEKLGDAAGKAGETIKKGASSVVDATKAASETVVDATKSGVGTVAKAGSDLTRKQTADASAIPSALEELLAQEEAAAVAVETAEALEAGHPITPAPVRKPAPTLPLFAEVPETVPAQHSPKRQTAKPSYRALALERGVPDTGSFSSSETDGPSPDGSASAQSHVDPAPVDHHPSLIATRLAATRDAMKAKLTTVFATDSASQDVSPRPSAGISKGIIYAALGTVLIGALVWSQWGKLQPQASSQSVEAASAPGLKAAAIDRSDRAEIEAIVHDYILTHPEIIPQAMDRYQAREVAQRVNSLRTELETPFSGAWSGAAKGDVTLVEFSDFACGFCRQSVNDVERLLREDKGLKVVHRELPILSAASTDAAKMALVAAKQGKYRSYYLAQFGLGTPRADTIKAAATKAGVDTEAARSAFLNSDLQAEIDKNLAMARQLGFSGTPTWIVGDRILQGAVGYAELKKAIAEARAAK